MKVLFLTILLFCCLQPAAGQEPSSTRQLGEVVVRSEKPLYQQRPEGTIVNVSRSVLTKGSTVLQLLERSPGVVIDYRNNGIALNGKSGVMVMLNGKLMRMPQDQLITLLNGMSANDIERIELLATPPPGYDAEGSAGIINIVSKKGRTEGTSGSVTATGGAGWGEKASASMNLEHHSGKGGVYGNYAFSHDKTRTDLYAAGTEIVPIFGGPTSFIFRNTTKAVRNSHNATAGVDARLTNTLAAGGSISYNNSPSSSMAMNDAEYRIYKDSLLLFRGSIDGKARWQHLSASAYMEKKIREGQQLNVDMEYLYYTNNNPTEVQNAFLDRNGRQADTDNQFAPRQRGASNTVIKVGVIKADYARQLGPKVKLETGLKGTYTRSTSISVIETLLNGGWTSRPDASNNIRMREGIGAAYVSLNAQLNSTLRLTAGLRYEYARTRLDSGQTGGNIVDREQGVLFPGISLTKQLNEHAALQAVYTKRISRPSYNDLSSFIFYNDPISVFTGNPLLKPTVTSNLKLGYSNRGYAFSVLLSHDRDPIARWQIVAGPGGNVVYISPQNMRYQDNLMVDASAPLKVNEWWSMSYSFTGGWRRFKIDYTAEPAVKAYFGYSLNGSQTFSMPRGFSAELSGWYNSVSYNGATRSGGFGALNAGIKKELEKNRGTLQLTATDILTSMRVPSTIGSFAKDAFSTRAGVEWSGESRHFPVIKLTYSRSFGRGNKGADKQRNGAGDEKERIRRD